MCASVPAGGQWDFAIPQMPANWDASAHIQHMQQQHEAEQQRQQAEEQAQVENGKAAAQYAQGMAGAHPADVSQIQQVRLSYRIPGVLMSGSTPLDAQACSIWVLEGVSLTIVVLRKAPTAMLLALMCGGCCMQVINAPPGVPIKLCRRCNQHKPLTDFYRSKANADGYDGRCKACDAVQCAERRRKKARVEVRLLSGPWPKVVRCC